MNKSLLLLAALEWRDDVRVVRGPRGGGPSRKFWSNEEISFLYDLGLGLCALCVSSFGSFDLSIGRSS